MIDLCCLVYRRKSTWVILSMIDANGGITQNQVEEATGWSQGRVSGYFTDLEDSGLIKKDLRRVNGRRLYKANNEKIENIRKAIVA